MLPGDLDTKGGGVDLFKCFSPSPCDRYGHFSGINRKVQLTYLPHGHPKTASEDEGKETWCFCHGVQAWCSRAVLPVQALEVQAELVTLVLSLLTSCEGSE